MTIPDQPDVGHIPSDLDAALRVADEMLAAIGEPADAPSEALSRLEN